nr:MAG TPA: hypothetical protein [Caudoviricetes sp.]
MITVVSSFFISFTSLRITQGRIVRMPVCLDFFSLNAYTIGVDNCVCSLY